MQITTEQNQQLIELFEDTVAYFCNENMLSGELVYTLLECYAIAKQEQLRGELD